SNTTVIEYEAFNYTPISSLTIPENVTKIGSDAFANNRNLKKVVFNARTVDDLSWGSPAFYNSGVLTGMEVVFGNQVSRIPAYLFYTSEEEPKKHYFTVNKVTISPSVKQVGYAAFCNCYMLKDVYYNSSDQAWARIKIEKENDPLLKATKHFASVTPTVNMFRMYNPNSGEHFYTGNEQEKNHLVSIGWKYEGVGFKAPVKSSTPMYRLYNPNAGDHHYTSLAAERTSLLKSGWKDEGIGWYADDAKGVAMYRLYNRNATGAGSHHYTSSEQERDQLKKLGWKYEGVGFYACK
ncbi:MAG: leucine-rich repeat domain-containing protein, partial [Solobacterium sp.]|nr:leucine-rich repeat domain-containing protein [Solobacterium sp.]